MTTDLQCKALPENTIVVFARAPVPGQVKTRLAQSIGPEAAAGLYAAMLRDSLALARRAARSVGNCEVVLAYTPDNAFDEGPHSLRLFWRGLRLAQNGNNLGERILNCITQLQIQGAQRVILIGSDSPDLLPALISHAFGHLNRQKWSASSQTTPMRVCDFVFGPSGDGGFYLIGAAGAVHQGLFQGIEWSTRRTLKQVLGNVRRLELRVALLPKWNDVDTIEDLRKLEQRRWQRHRLPPHTRRWLQSENLF